MSWQATQAEFFSGTLRKTLKGFLSFTEKMIDRSLAKHLSTQVRQLPVVEDASVTQNAGAQNTGL